MPIPLGIFAVAGAGGAAALPAYEQIATQVLSSGVASVTFSSIPSTYRHLEVRLTHREPSSNNNENALIQFNGDTASNYSSHRLISDGAIGSYSTLTNYIRYRVPGNVFTGVWAGGILSILDYAQTTKNKTTKMLGGYCFGNGSSEIGLYSGSWRNTAAITSITFSSVNGNGIMAGSRFSLYGIKG
jgi:hypothetical protein